jgi:phosphocarrier protein HPr
LQLRGRTRWQLCAPLPRLTAASAIGIANDVKQTFGGTRSRRVLRERRTITEHDINTLRLDRRPMLQQETTIVNKLGLHARASAKLTQLAGNYQAEIWMSRNGRRINAKSIMGVMMLAAGIGSTVLIETEGPDEADAMSALLKLIADKFGEGQ